ncbi:MAG TPA: hypothetical protein VH083_01050 [Myxococcales bacterium]|jgi:hypothetical protein|nr:hypothetical protein [Myxococcales bacterium]
MAKKSKGKSKAATPKKASLPEFFQGLDADPDKLEQFSSTLAGRKQVIENSNLSDEHKAVLKKGCIPDIIRAFSGLPPAPEGTGGATMAINCCDEMGCEHKHCNAFSQAAAVPVAKPIPVARAKTTAKKGSAKGKAKKPTAKKPKR